MSKPKEHTVTVQYTVTDRFLHGFWIDWLEGNSSDYWIDGWKKWKKREYFDRKGESLGVYTSSVMIHEGEDGDPSEDDEGWFLINDDTIVLGVNRLLAPGAKVSSDIRFAVIQDIHDDDGGTMDIWCYDAVIQFALFGELRYG